MEILVLLFDAVDVLMRGSLLGEGDEASPLVQAKLVSWRLNNDSEFAYGAGHLNLATTENPGLVYDFDKMSCIISMPWRPYLVGTKSIN
ncbi:hypothetical protein J1N35_012852 [Gossypium stocksii]|uniref:Uncharacterized protein n=1 Tax=Gossypium stocksii TaxID=47602 RepID=A0A9D4A8A5_9ROSI|nr:hypothetical protein J1N35_012852 [Gossypium stocksii]